MFCCTWAVGCQKFVQNIRMLWSGRFILVESVSGKNRQNIFDWDNIRGSSQEGIHSNIYSFEKCSTKWNHFQAVFLWSRVENPYLEIYRNAMADTCPAFWEKTSSIIDIIWILNKAPEKDALESKSRRRSYKFLSLWLAKVW